MRPVVFSPAARAEANDARNWYETRGTDLGQRFVNDLDAVIDRISASPVAFPVIRNGVRRAMLRRFPYAVFFRVLPELVQVIACFHTSRNPVRWQRRT